MRLSTSAALIQTEVLLFAKRLVERLARVALSIQLRHLVRRSVAPSLRRAQQPLRLPAAPAVPPGHRRPVELY